ncbi:hypothetical protein BHM03_00018690 [Ensete ventricosum]|nr:hypothetical protein BHM03_00018690 [Ensete ventricosum]
MSRERRDHAKGNCSKNTRVLKQAVKRGKEAMTSLEGLSYPRAKRQSEKRWTPRSATMPQRRIYRSRRKGRKYKATYSKATGLAVPWYHRDDTSEESSISCSHGRRALVMKGAKEVENVKANSKYQDKVEGQRLRNFLRPMSTGFSSRYPKVGDFGLMQECLTKE